MLTPKLEQARRTPKLEFAQGDGDGLDGGADGGQQATENSHDQSEENAHHQKVEGDFERESQIGEGLKVHGVGGEAVQRQNRKAAQ